MPFTRTTNPPSTNAKVTVEFAGLMSLEAGENNSCIVGVHRWTYTHTFQATLIVCKPDRPPSLVRLFTGPLTGAFLIRLDPDPNQGSFRAFAPTDDPFVRSAAANNHDFDYRWAINMREYHTETQTNDGASPGGTLMTGVLYTPTLTRPGMNPQLVRAGSNPRELYRISADLAAAIETPDGTQVWLQWRELGETKHLTLPRAYDPEGTTYIVSLLNDPPIGTPVAHDEIELYYKILETNAEPIPDDEQWRLEYVHFEKTDEIPCMPITLEP